MFVVSRKFKKAADATNITVVLCADCVGGETDREMSVPSLSQSTTK